MNTKYIEHNGSGVIDPTIDTVIKKEYNRKEHLKEECNYIEMKANIKRILEKNGYMLEGPISLIHIKTGEKRRIY
jgi:hypothetical protein